MLTNKASPQIEETGGSIPTLLRAFMEQISIATGEVAYGASLSALGPVMLPNARLLSELNVPKGKPRMRPLIQCPDIVPCASASRRAGLGWWILRRLGPTVEV